jgi:O-antigen/teichoic acid export membrane protein
LVEEALAYAGLLMIPGLVGGALLGERILRIYGPEFTQGATVLVVLIVANLVMSYQSQLLNTLNALNRPDLSFRVNTLFVVGNLSLNVVFVYLYGWLGAAIATVCSITISAVLAYYYLERIINVGVPVSELGRQSIAAILMGALVYAGVRIENAHVLLGHNVAVLVVLVGGGAAIYFFALICLSARFRTAIEDNLPFDVPTP